jgi:hypothetical protein
MTLGSSLSEADAARGVIYDRHMFIVQATGNVWVVIIEQHKLDNNAGK